MRAKTISIIVLTVLVTVILMKNMDEVNFWIFGTRSVPKLAVLGTMFFIGAVVGFLIGRPKKKVEVDEEYDVEEEEANKPLNQDDNDYIN
ncbi:hypothetical protein [Parapedobacter sp. 10938]|uniref:hypothetical protein n=1 Tax=Parapedobacter flavus TaxID=3110225 RepID=UPI002DB672DF|nr:hypothetical protein [Parapedobacter sp. 10938]MEC3878763.1 hypothetical protein [Parapedobacter sp. 10938]